MASGARLAAARTEQMMETATQFEFKPGLMIGHYRVERRLGAGGMGVVYLATDTQLGRPATLKILKSGLTQDGARVRRFRQEARAASALNHPNILTIYEIGQTEKTEQNAGGVHFIVAEFVDGQTLTEKVGSSTWSEDQKGLMTLGAAFDLLIQVAAALSAAHEAGIVHRDIKPENLMLRRDGIIKVLDFGLAKLTEHALRPPGDSFAYVTTQPGVVMGTVSYMSPEQARGLKVDARSDLFSLGVVMYQLLTGCAPFDGETSGDVLASLLLAEPQPLARHDARLPAALQRIVNRALAKSVADRYQSAREMGDDLKQLKEELEFAAKLKDRTGSKDDVLTLSVGARSAAAGQNAAGQVSADDSAAHPNAALATFAARKITDPIATGKRENGFLRARHYAALRGWLALYGKLAAVFTALTAVVLLAWWGWAPRAGTIDKIAVLPFANEGKDPLMEYLPDGLTESLIDGLSKLPGLTVMARATILTYKDRPVDSRQIGDKLDVRAVLTGSVRREGERLVIRAELVETATGTQLWGARYERALAELQTVPGAITREISDALRLRLSSDARQQIAGQRAENSEAYHLYLRGRYLYNQGTQASQQQALDHYQRAIEQDARYAPAHAGIAHVYAVFSSQYLPPSEAIPKARQAAQKALDLDEKLPEAHYAIALVKWWGDWDWAAAERELKRAIELNPNFIDAHVSYANLITQQGRFDEALRASHRADELNPLGTLNTYTDDRVFYYSRQYDRAIARGQKRLESNPDHVALRLFLGLALSQKGLHQEAIREMRQVVALSSTHSHLAWLAYVLARGGQQGEALKTLRELEELAPRERISPIYVARIYVGLSNQEKAFAWLQKAYEERSDHLLSLKIDPIYDPLRADPRFAELARGIGLVN
ncbi:MAG: protein kinase [Blastocatellia bacterium]